ncbi:MAG: L-rhamnose/proton symporter RhaT [Bryobacteraceae bacterium]|jgi:L-rhamnose-H+ transport protein
MQIELGIFLALAAGLVNGLFALPMKGAREWAWENVWLPFSVAGLILFPRLIALSAAPKLEDAYGSLEAGALLIPILWGMAVYTGSLLFGISLTYIGNALAFALLVGSMSIVGVLGPIVAWHPAVLGTSGGRWILAGIGSLFVALIVCATAGTWKARAQSGLEDRARAKSVTGMALAIAGGLLSGLLSLGMGMRWAGRIAAAAIEHGGATRASAANAVLVLVLLGGAVPNCLYCVYLLFRNRSWKRYRSHGGYWLIVILMAAMFSGSVALWGVSTAENMLGRLGPSVGWALFIGAIVVSSNIGGFATGEWKGAGGKPLRTMVGGLALMVLAMVFIGYGNYLLNV